ncbi:hypothetical protein SASPL_152739 [Salvia splendens]|uniref:Solute carrier family 39 (Zinc transporter), member 1/2/3 n=1 Tax=Salvia splendens TaxID=180675 RepID=A0A8X8W3K8_SALSN|nr:hypothetical protein SASPL_152739 [Salvia splendens]
MYFFPPFCRHHSKKYAIHSLLKTLPHSAMISPHKIFLLIAVSATSAAAAEDPTEAASHGNKSEALKLKLVAISSILTAGGLGASFPLLGRKLAALLPENDIFLMVKAFAGGVVLATGFVHILPDAFRSLTSPKFPFSGFIAMAAAIATLVVDTVATSFYGSVHSSKDEEAAGDADSASGPNGTTQSDILRQRIISQVLEVGMVVHSVVIGISLGAARSAATIKPLLIALCFHQFFEGMGLGGCISQARFEWLKTVVMTVFFSVGSGLESGLVTSE